MSEALETFPFRCRKYILNENWFIFLNEELSKQYWSFKVVLYVNYDLVHSASYHYRNNWQIFAM